MRFFWRFLSETIHRVDQSWWVGTHTWVTVSRCNMSTWHPILIHGQGDSSQEVGHDAGDGQGRVTHKTLEVTSEISSCRPNAVKIRWTGHLYNFIFKIFWGNQLWCMRGLWLVTLLKSRNLRVWNVYILLWSFVELSDLFLIQRSSISGYKLINMKDFPLLAWITEATSFTHPLTVTLDALAQFCQV